MSRCWFLSVQAIYTADTGSPAVVLKIDKALMTISKKIVLDTGENDVRTLVLNPADKWLYASTHTRPGRVVKINRVDMTRTAALKVTEEEKKKRNIVQCGDLRV
jgi:hypothetical protein